MFSIARTVIAHTGLDNCAFNIEFFWNLEQDSYSYAICHLFIGGRDRKELLDTYMRCTEMLPFEFSQL
ncbi:MAG: hypothetical protein K9K82_04730 [Desulfobacteraceae bacterium]|nr:hypothetical protein [Desulfobacteraceae bacterium]